MRTAGPNLDIAVADEHQRLKGQGRVALIPWELDQDDLRALEVAEPPAEAAQFDAELPSR